MPEEENLTPLGWVIKALCIIGAEGQHRWTSWYSGHVSVRAGSARRERIERGRAGDGGAREKSDNKKKRGVKRNM